MPLYSLVPTIGAGTRRNPWRPLGHDQQTGAIRLVPGGATGDRSQALWILEHQAPLVDARVTQLGLDKADDAGTLVRSRLVTQLQYSVGELQATRLDDLVLHLLDKPPANGWNRLQPNGRRWEIWMGGQKWTNLPVITGGAGSSFDGSEDPLSEGATWESGYTADISTLLKLSGRVRRSAAGWAAGRYLGATYADPQVSQCEVYQNGTGGAEREGSLCTRMHPNSTTDSSMYVASAMFHDGNHLIYERDAAFGFTGLGNDAVAPTSGQTYKFTSNGSSHTFTANGTNRAGGPYTDSTLSAGTYSRVGIGVSASTASEIELDNWTDGVVTIVVTGTMVSGGVTEAEIVSG